MSVILALGKNRQEDQEVKIIFGYIESLRLAWAIWDIASKNKQKPIDFITVPAIFAFL